MRAAARALRLAQLRAECTKYLCALTSDNVYALYRDAVGLIARYVGDGSSSNLQKSETVPECTVCDVMMHMERGARVRAALDAAKRRSAAAAADDLKRTKALDDEKAADAAEVRRAARALRLAQLRAECTKYLCAVSYTHLRAHET